MKYTVLGLSAAIIIVFVIVWLRGGLSDAPIQPMTPPADFAGPQTPPPTMEGTPTSAPITKSNKKTIKNGMTIETIKEGNGVAIIDGQTAVVEYKGMFPNGEIFDASERHGQSFSFTVGAGQVIKGWDQGVLGMKVGEMRKLTVPPELGYGAQGAGGVIPPNATLIFEVTLIAIK